MLLEVTPPLPCLWLCYFVLYPDLSDSLTCCAWSKCCALAAGKTLIARQIGKMLNGKEPKIVNGPEVLNKYVGASEENIRALFAEAEADQEAHKEYSELHVIIFDEIDAICKSRGSVRDGSGVHDTVVNQLLTKIDGVDSLNNILLIGMTNRKDMLDEALLRPGRLEVQVEIGLPDDKGRLQILKVIPPPCNLKFVCCGCFAASTVLQYVCELLLPICHWLSLLALLCWSQHLFIS